MGLKKIPRPKAGGRKVQGLGASRLGPRIKSMGQRAGPALENIRSDIGQSMF